MYYVDLPDLQGAAQTPGAIKRLIASGRILPETLICEVGGDEWFPASTISKWWEEEVPAKINYPARPRFQATPAVPAVPVVAVAERVTQPEQTPSVAKDIPASGVEHMLNILGALSLVGMVVGLFIKRGEFWFFVGLGNAVVCFWMAAVITYLRRILSRLK